MTVTLGTVDTNVPGVDDALTTAYEIVELVGVSDKAVVIYHQTDAGLNNDFLRARVISISGTTITGYGSQATPYTTTEEIRGGWHAYPIDATRIALSWVEDVSGSTRGKCKAVILSISGTTVSFGSAVIIADETEFVYDPDGDPFPFMLSSTVMGVIYTTEDGIGNPDEIQIKAATLTGTAIGSPSTAAVLTTAAVVGNNYVARYSEDGDRALVLWQLGASIIASVVKVTAGPNVSIGTLSVVTTATTPSASDIVRTSDTEFIIGYSRSGLCKIRYLAIDAGTDTISGTGAEASWGSSSSFIRRMGNLSATLLLVGYLHGSGDGRIVEVTIAGTGTSTVYTPEIADEASLGAATTGAGLGTGIRVGINKVLAMYTGSIDAVIASTSLITLDTTIWLRNAAGTWSDIGDPGWTDPVRAIYSKPDTYQIIWAAVGTEIWKTENGGTSWVLKATLTFEAEGLDGLPEDDRVIAYTKDAGGTNRVAVIDNTTITYIDTGHSTTGKGSTIRGIS